MPRILIIADDLTGGAEVGGVAFRCGLSVQIVFDLASADNNKEVTILDTNSRNIEPGIAYQNIWKQIESHDFSEYDLIFKKTDSVLRGPVVQEIRACMDKAGFRNSLLIPANPSRNRIIKDGKYFIDNIPISETEFKLDPTHPAISNNIFELLDEANEIIITSNLKEDYPSGKIIIPDVISNSDIQKFVSKIESKPILPAGGVDFFQSLLESGLNLIPGKPEYSFASNDKKCFIIGSNSQVSRNNILKLKKLNYKILALPERAITNQLIYEKWLISIDQALSSDKNLVITGPEKFMNAEGVAQNITDKIVFASRKIMDSGRNDYSLFIEGGETASDYFKRTGSKVIVIKGISNVGIVTISPEGTNVEVTIKPGSYLWPQELFHESK